MTANHTSMDTAPNDTAQGADPGVAPGTTVAATLNFQR